MLAGLQVAVNDAPGVRGLERVSQRCGVFHELGDVERAAPQTLLQALPFEQLHDEKPAAPVDPDIMNGADVRMIDAGDCPASRSNRASAAESPDVDSGRILRATSRCRRLSRARYTSPMPPVPRRPRISYGPSRVPASRDMEERLAAEYTLFSPRPGEATSPSSLAPAHETGCGCGPPRDARGWNAHEDVPAKVALKL